MMPDYSPDGQRLVFAMFRNAPTDLFVANLDGSDLATLTRTPIAPSSPPTGGNTASVALSARARRSSHARSDLRRLGGSQWP